MKRITAYLLALCLVLSGCGLLSDPGKKPEASSERTVYAMDTEMSLRLYGDEDGKAMDELSALLARLDRSLSVTRPESALSALNESGRSEDEDLFALTEAAKTISARTQGALDITLYPVTSLWGFTTGSYRVPAQEELEDLRPLTGMDRITLADGAVTLEDGTKLDFGALGKGYAADLCRQELERRGLSGILSLGGNIQTVGKKPDGSSWVIGLQSPDDPGAFAATLTLTGSRAVVTSGDYQRCFEQDGRLWHHIFDPQTLRPADTGLRAVTVVADSGLLADGLATALFVLGKDAALELWRASGDFEAVFIDSDGSLTVTAGLKDAISGTAYTVAER